MTVNGVRLMISFMVAAMVNQTVTTILADEPLVFVSSFAAGEKGAIQAYRLETKAGTLQPIQRTGDIEHPFFFVISLNHRYLYSIHAKTFGGSEPEQVAAYSLDGRTGRMTLINRQSTRGTASCYLDIDATGKSVLVANYTTGNIASFPVKSDGSLGEAVSFFQHAGSSVDPIRQKGPNAHCIVVSPDNRFAFVADLGIDQVLSYRLDAATAKLSPNQTPFVKSPAGAGPRHLTFHPNGKHVYVINELKNSVTMFDYATASGVLSERQTISTLPADFSGTSHCADLKITPDGRFLYGTNRGHHSIAAYRIGSDGQLALIGIKPSRGDGPQNLLIADNGRLLLCANMPGNNVAIFRIDQQSGELTPNGDTVSITSPSCIRLVP
jgi:6-phosphogluconolactonase